MLLTASALYKRALFQPVADGGMWHRWDIEPFVPTGLAITVPLRPCVNEGRWLVQCPCGGAQLTSPGDERFFCIECLNQGAGRLWVRVDWTDIDAAGIDRVLASRPPVNRNWRDPESLDDLIQENAGHELV